jgi:hypothetical protein
VDGQFHVFVILTPNVDKWSSSSCLIPGHEARHPMERRGGANLDMMAKRNILPLLGVEL